MLTIRELIKTLYNALTQKMKKYRGNWDQNDPTADDYIKNRPFYTDGYITLIKNKTFITYEDYELCSPFAFKIVEGEVYKVIWNGKEYECIACIDRYGGTYIGNIGLMNEGKYTGEPFFYDYMDYGDGDIEYFWCVKNSGTHTMSIYKQNVKKIDSKYLPENNNAEIEVAIDDLYSYANYLEGSISSIPTDVVRYGTTQNLNTTAKDRARTNIGAVGYESQSLSDTQKAQARTNIGAVSSDEVTGVVKHNVVQNLTVIQKKIARTNIDAIDANSVNEAINNVVESLRDGIAFIDQVNGYTYIACMRDGNFVTHIGIKSIEVSTAPNKTEYMIGDYFDPTGMVVVATTYDGTTKEVIDIINPSSYILEGDTFVEIKYVEGGITHIATVPITTIPFDPTAALVDFEYTANNDGTYTITSWKGTLNGEPSTEIIIPNNSLIIV